MKSVAWMIGTLLILISAACGQRITGPTETRDASYDVGDLPKVVVSGGNGRIIVNSGMAGKINVQAILRRPDDLEFEISQSGNTISIDVKDKGVGIFNFGSSPGADIEITGPSDTSVKLRTGNGSVEVHGMKRSGSVHTSNGTVLMDGVTGEFEVSTSNGRVEILQSSGTFEIDTSNGRIEFDGELSPGGSNRMTTSNGSVQITLQGTPSIKLDASTSNGSVDTGFPILITAPLDEHHVVGTIGDGDADLFVRTSNGSISIE